MLIIDKILGLVFHSHQAGENDIDKIVGGVSHKHPTPATGINGVVDKFFSFLMHEHTAITPPPPPADPIYLYNWAAVVDPRGLAPAGYDVASEDDWADLLGYLGGQAVAGGKLKAVLGFDAPNTGATDEVGFEGITTGMRNPDGTFANLGTYSYHWIKNINE